MPYLIDSDILIDHLATAPAGNDLLTRLAPEGIAISIITYMETYQGVLRDPQRETAARKFEAVLATIPILPFSLPSAKRCAALREHLKREGKRVNSRALDLLNAAIALEHNLTLVTQNREDYADIPDLTIYKLHK
jgi:predicted nucleic acid-binding protein